MEFKFDDHSYNKLLEKAGVKGSGIKVQLSRVLIPVFVFWLPPAIITLFKGTFWAGQITDSFITDFDVQARLLVAMPILILADKLVSLKLGLIIGQFVNSGIVGEEIKESYNNIVQRNLQFLRSHWTDLVIIIICYIQIILVFYYESENTLQLSWQIDIVNGETSFNLAGIWYVLISAPFVLFLCYRWLLRIIVWGKILYKTSNLKITLFPMHPDLAGGLGFLGYAIRYFSPVALAFSSIVAGNMADFMLIEDVHLAELKFPVVCYFLLITFMFSLPLAAFIGPLTVARELSVFQNYEFTNGLLRELKAKMSKGYKSVSPKDLTLPDFSAAADLSAVVDNSLKMKFVPFTLKDFVSLWIFAGIPFLGILIIEIPINQLFQDLISFIL